MNGTRAVPIHTLKIRVSKLLGCSHSRLGGIATTQSIGTLRVATDSVGLISASTSCVARSPTSNWSGEGHQALGPASGIDPTVLYLPLAPVMVARLKGFQGAITPIPKGHFMSVEIYIDDNKQEFSTHLFSGGEIHVRLGEPVSSRPARVRLVARLHSSVAPIELLMVTDALRRRYGNDLPIDLVAPYLPYARQDRVCYPGEALSLRVVCDLINAQRYASVEVWDAHSDVALALLNRVRHRECVELVANLAPALRDGGPVIVAPDAGAIKRTATCAKRIGWPMVRAEKIRDPNDGSITGTVVHSDPIGDRDFLMIDDICDGGRTFIELAKELRPLTTGHVLLYITHGIFSQGFDVFRGAIDHIFVANSFHDDLPEFVSKI
jgi:ribose-phosphate pyrophosphokinase